MDRRPIVLKCDATRWTETAGRHVPTLQVFITDRCNLRCRACFYASRLGSTDMPLSQYWLLIREAAPHVRKVVLLGGEPTLHPDLGSMLELNRLQGLQTTIYTNGRSLDRLRDLDLTSVRVRVGVYGATGSEKPVAAIADYAGPLTFVYMLRRDNVAELAAAAKLIESRFDCRGLFLSSIRDIAATHDYWADTPATLPAEEYAATVREFLDSYDGGLPRLDVATRGVLVTERERFDRQRHCRFANVFPDGAIITCPFDISLERHSPAMEFNARSCNKHDACILQKIVLKRK